MARTLQLPTRDSPVSAAAVTLESERSKSPVGSSFFRCCCRCWRTGDHALLADDVESFPPQRLGAETISPTGEPRLTGVGSDDEGFHSADEGGWDASCPTAVGSSATPSMSSGKMVLPKLNEDADDSEVAAYEDMEAATVSSKLIDDICNQVGWDVQDVASRLSARRFAVANAGNMNKILRHINDNKVWLQKERPRFAELPVSNPLFFQRGWDRRGHPLLIYNGPRISVVRPSPEEMVLYTASVFQGLCDLLESGDYFSKTEGFTPQWRLQKVTMVVFLPKGSEPDWRAVGPVLTVLQRQFPERLYRALIFPTGRTTTFLWGIAKRFLDPRTVRKVVFLDGGEKPDGLLEFIAPEQLPEEFGGRDSTPLP
mmetsp:Transcript_30023/g.69933  ORF Transcript_30023/g.69933 Transcript_30023/m.69933 type:complete len:370 (-) Transcript_30023:31-1140(-)